jgi:hypothetical protein
MKFVGRGSRNLMQMVCVRNVTLDPESVPLSPFSIRLPWPFDSNSFREITGIWYITNTVSRRTTYPISRSANGCQNNLHCSRSISEQRRPPGDRYKLSAAVTFDHFRSYKTFTSISTLQRAGPRSGGQVPDI